MKTPTAQRRYESARSAYARHRLTAYPEAADIPLRTAQAAYTHLSHSPERRGEQAVQDYVETLNNARRRIFAAAPNPDAAEAAYATVRAGLKADTLAYLSAQSRSSSWMITGRSGRNEAREGKRLATVDRRREEMLGNHARRVDAALASFRRAEKAALDPIEDLRSRLAERERLQAGMTEANKIVRKKGLTDDEKRAALSALGMSSRTIANVMSPDDYGKLGFPSYALTNNSAEIRRLKERLVVEERRAEAAAVARAAMAAEAEAGDDEDESNDPFTYPFTGSAAYPYAGTVEYDYPGRRILLRFSVRIPREVFDEIRRTTGFNWSRTQNAFSAVMGAAAVYAAKRITGADLPSVV